MTFATAAFPPFIIHDKTSITKMYHMLELQKKLHKSSVLNYMFCNDLGWLCLTSHR